MNDDRNGAAIILKFAGAGQRQYTRQERRDKGPEHRRGKSPPAGQVELLERRYHEGRDLWDGTPLEGDDLAGVSLLRYPDMEPVLALERRVFSRTDPDFGVEMVEPDAWKLRELIRYTAEEAQLGYGIFEAADILVGYAMVARTDDDFRIDRLVIDPEYQGMGFGSAMIVRVLRWAAKSKKRCDVVCRVPFGSGTKPPIGFFLKFARDNRVPFKVESYAEKDVPESDAVQVRMSLSPALRHMLRRQVKSPF
jgi:GNAT superfamily N-acetyltransferase